jgi:transcription initiation factor TFIID subunit 3
MSSHALHSSLLRPPVLHILRAAGFHAIRPAVLDTLVDLASRYLILLAQKTAAHALTSRDETTATIIDARLALQDVGALRPQMSTMEEQRESEEDMRGMDAFVRWLTGEENREIRRIAGLVPSEGEIVALEASEPREDFFTSTSPAE